MIFKERFKKNFINFNRKIFKRKEYQKNIILTEFNAFQPFHVSTSIASNYLAKKYSARIIAFYNYALVVSPLRKNLFNKVKWYLGIFFGLKKFGIYKSFGVSEFISPIMQYKNIDSIVRAIYNSIHNKNDIIKIKLYGIIIGDLLNDSYIKYFKTYTVDYKSKKFYNYLRDFIYLFFYWKDYIDKNREKIKCIIGCHAVYAYGLPLRIAIFNGIRVICIINGQVFNLTKKRPFANSEYLDFKKKFKLIAPKEKKLGLLKAKKSLIDRFKGRTGLKINDLFFPKSSFNPKYKSKKKVLNSNKNIKVLIAAHEVHDAATPLGPNFFSDFYEWMLFLMKISKLTNYDWYLKNHPTQEKLKLIQNQQITMNITSLLLKKFPNIRSIDPNIPHNQLIREGIDFVLTVRGTVAIEYAYAGIPVLIATKSNFTRPYTFNKHFKNKDDYKKQLLNLDKFKMIIKKTEVLQHFFMRFIYTRYSDFMPFFEEFNKINKNFDKYFTDDFYEFYINRITKTNFNLLNVITRRFENFYNSNDYILGRDHF